MRSPANNSNGLVSSPGAASRAINWVKNNPIKTTVGVGAAAGTVICIVAEPCGLAEGLAALGFGGEEATAAAATEEAATSTEIVVRGFTAEETQGLKGLFGQGAKGAERFYSGVTKGEIRSLPSGVIKNTLQRYINAVIETGPKAVVSRQQQLRIQGAISLIRNLP